MWRTWGHRVIHLAGCVLVPVAGAAPAAAVDGPVIEVSVGRAIPARLEVHVGERVRWRGPSGQRVWIELDPHRDAHEVVVREGEIQAVFLATGEHWYRGSLMDDGKRRPHVTECQVPTMSCAQCGQRTVAALAVGVPPRRSAAVGGLRWRYVAGCIT